MNKTEMLICNVHGISEFSLSGIKKPRWKCKKCMYDVSKNYLYELKIKCILYKGGKCERCGYDKCPRSMDFHHVDPTQKDFSLGDRNPNTNKKGTKKWETVRMELDKCILVCRNCHSEIHEELDKRQEQSNLGLHRQRIHLLNQHILKGRKTPQEIMESLTK